MRIDDQIRLAENRTKMYDILRVICEEYALRIDEVLQQFRDSIAKEARQMFIGVCHLKLNFNQTEIARMIGISQPHAHRGLCIFFEDLEDCSETQEIYQKIINKLELS